MSLKTSLVKLARQSPGGHATHAARLSFADRFAQAMRVANIQIKSLDHLKAGHIRSFVEARQAQGVDTRTVVNDLAHLRVLLREAGREAYADRPELSNAALGLERASREGTKEAIPVERLADAVYLAAQRDAGVAMALQVADALGLRAQEAVQGAASLGTWLRQVESGAAVRVTLGTKGGRPRHVHIHPQDRANVAQTLRAAVELARGQGGRLVDAPDLRTAMFRFHRVARAAGLVGEHAPHSIRYAWAQRQVESYRASGLSEAEARAAVSLDLGHGDGRGRYVSAVYGLRQA